MLPMQETNKLPDLPEYEEENEAAGQKPQKVDLAELQNLISPDLKGHNWRQKGPYLVCTSCKLKHSLFVGLTKRLKWVKEDGEIVLEDVH